MSGTCSTETRVHEDGGLYTLGGKPCIALYCLALPRKRAEERVLHPPKNPAANQITSSEKLPAIMENNGNGKIFIDATSTRLRERKRRSKKHGRRGYYS